MTDIIERLRRRSLYLDGSSATRVMEEAAEEIERLRLLHENSKHWEAQHLVEIERLRAVIIRAKDALLDGQSTQWVHDLLVEALCRKPKP